MHFQFNKAIKCLAFDVILITQCGSWETWVETPFFES